MSLLDIRPYFKSRCEAVGLKQHMDVFNLDNIPSTFIDYSYHISVPKFDGIKLNQNDQEIQSNIIVSFFIKGHRSVTDAIDKSISKTNDLIVEVEKPQNRLGVNLKNVTLVSVNYDPVGSTNDNIIKTSIEFRVYLTIGF